MNIASKFFLLTAITLTIVLINIDASAQQYKIRQVTNMMGMKSETTVYVKGVRKRTEGGGFAGMPNQLATIEQCDLQRLITINDKKKLYHIAPFSKESEEVVDDGDKPVKAKPVVSQTKSTQKGGTVIMYYNITDTGERKKMYGLTARRVWTTQKIKPSADACMMKDSMVIKTDGWYIDLPQFNCPVRYAPTNAMASGMQQIDCKDKFVTKRSGKGKLGFPLIEKKTMIMGDGAAQTSQFETDLETLELSTTKLDSMLFEIPPAYSLAKTIEELQEKMDASSIRESLITGNTEKTVQSISGSDPKRAGAMRIGVLVPAGADQLQVSELQTHLASCFNTEKLEAVPVSTADQAKSFHCDLLLTTKILQVKQASKIGGLLKAIKNSDPTSASSYHIEAVLTLTNLADGASWSEKKVSGKFEGTADGAAKKALSEGSHQLMKSP
jgi:hypothetical protein